MAAERRKGAPYGRVMVLAWSECHNGIDDADHYRAVRTRARIMIGLLAGGLSQGCAGQTRLQETYYLAAPDGTNTNFYRIRVRGVSVLSKAEFRHGWYPRSAVDSLFGSVSKEAEPEYRKQQRKIEEGIDQAIADTHKRYLEKATDPEVTSAELEKYMEAHRRVRYLPTTPAREDLIVMEHDPTVGLKRLHGEDKIVIVMSSNPDEVVQSIARVVEDQKTQDFVTEIADTFGQQEATRAKREAAQAELDDAPLIDALEAAIEVLEDSTASKVEVERALLEVKESL